MSYLFPLLWCHPVFLITTVSPHSIQNTMSSRAITIVSSGRSTELDYNGNVLVLIPVTLLFMSLRCFKYDLYFLGAFSFFVIRVEDAQRSALHKSQTPAGGGQGVWYRLHPWPQQQLRGLQPTYKSPLQQTFTWRGWRTSWGKRYESGRAQDTDTDTLLLSWQRC